MLSLRKTYGHELIKAIKLSRADKWVAISDKHVYYVLRKLAREGLVVETEEREGNTPPRKVYEITDAGKARLVTLLQAEDLQTATANSPFDAVIGILAYTEVMSPAEAIAVLEKRRDALVHRMEEDHPDGFGEFVEGLYGYFARALYEKARLLLAHEIAWMEDVIARAKSSDWEGLRVPREFLHLEEM